MARDLVLLTGASGFVGLHILQHLLRASYRVRVALRPTASFDAILACPSVKPFAEHIECCIVKDIAAPHAYDDAIKGVQLVVHCASPLLDPALEKTDMQKTVVEPALRGTMNMLEAAAKEPGVRRVVITASGGSISNPAYYPGYPVTINEETRYGEINGPPYPNYFQAYVESKQMAYQAVERFVAEKKPHFNVVQILPVMVFGPNELYKRKTDAAGSADLILGPLRGIEQTYPHGSMAVHVDDVARMHVLSLSRVDGNESFLASWSHEPIAWADVAEIVKRRFSKEVAAGLLDVETMAKSPTTKASVDGRKAAKFFGFEYKSFEEMVVDTVTHWLTLAD